MFYCICLTLSSFCYILTHYSELERCYILIWSRHRVSFGHSGTAGRLYTSASDVDDEFRPAFTVFSLTVSNYSTIRSLCGFDVVVTAVVAANTGGICFKTVPNSVTLAAELTFCEFSSEPPQDFADFIQIAVSNPDTVGTPEP